MSEEPTRKGISLSTMKYHMAMMFYNALRLHQYHTQSKCACLLHWDVLCVQAENADGYYNVSRLSCW